MHWGMRRMKRSAAGLAVAVLAAVAPMSTASVLEAQESNSEGEGTTYNLTGFGLGLGWTVRRVTASVEVVLGEADRSDPDLYGHLGVSLQYRIPGIGSG